MEFVENEFVWSQKYRPNKIDDCIIPESLKEIFNQYVEKGEFSNLLLVGTAGSGKTTLAKALANELNMEVLFINASENGNIDTLRTTIRQFASTRSLTGRKKLVILDEADHLNPQSTQPALRGFIEEFSKSTRFILTANFKNKIISPLHSRTTVIEFNPSKKDKVALAKSFFLRVREILDAEGVSYKPAVLAEIVKKFIPDFRRTLNELQTYSQQGSINEDVLSYIESGDLDDLFGALKSKQYKKMRDWVAENTDMDMTQFFSEFFLGMYERIEQDSIPYANLLIGEWSYKSAFIPDNEVAMSAFLTQVMAEVEFK